MAKWIVTHTIKLTHIVEATNREEAKDIAADLGEYAADGYTTITARQIKECLESNILCQ